jgi:hypothetical protein
LVYRVQFSDVAFYSFLNNIGLTPAKSLTMRDLKIPDKFFQSFLRGYFDGDGYSYSYYDKRWKNSFMFYVCFCSASVDFVSWIRRRISDSLKIDGHVGNPTKNNSCYQLKYSKREALILANYLYEDSYVIRLSRKHLKISQVLDIVNGAKNKS